MGGEEVVSGENARTEQGLSSFHLKEVEGTGKNWSSEAESARRWKKFHGTSKGRSSQGKAKFPRKKQRNVGNREKRIEQGGVQGAGREVSQTGRDHCQTNRAQEKGKKSRRD